MTHYIHQTSKTNAEGKGDLFRERETEREASSSSTSKKEEDEGMQDWYVFNCLMCTANIHIEHLPSATSMTH